LCLHLRCAAGREPSVPSEAEHLVVKESRGVSRMLLGSGAKTVLPGVDLEHLLRRSCAAGTLECSATTWLTGPEPKWTWQAVWISIPSTVIRGMHRWESPERERNQERGTDQVRVQMAGGGREGDGTATGASAVDTDVDMDTDMDVTSPAARAPRRAPCLMGLIARGGGG